MFWNRIHFELQLVELSYESYESNTSRNLFIHRIRLDQHSEWRGRWGYSLGYLAGPQHPLPQRPLLTTHLVPLPRLLGQPQDQLQDHPPGQPGAVQVLLWPILHRLQAARLLLQLIAEKQFMKKTLNTFLSCDCCLFLISLTLSTHKWDVTLCCLIPVWVSVLNSAMDYYQTVVQISRLLIE